MNAPSRARALVAIVAVAVFCLTLALSPAAHAEEATIHYENESLQTYEQQLNGGQIAAVTVNKRIRSLRITLKDGRHVKARYAAHQEKSVVGALEAKNVHVSILKPAEAQAEAKKVPVHHKLRYIVGGALIAVVLIVGAVVLIRRRRVNAE